MWNMSYDSIFITNIPSFYKLNLYNRLAVHKKIFVVFLDDAHSNRNQDFYSGQRNFEWMSISGKSKLGKLLYIFRLLWFAYYHEVIICGWDELAYWLAALISPKSKNAVIVESSYIESVSIGLKGAVKKLFVSRMSKAYVSGKAQQKLLDGLGFKGECKITKGVGVFNILPKPPYRNVEKIVNFIYVGRLSSEKNLEYMINTFNNHPELNLNIVGFGPLERELKSIANTNVIFHGATDNKELPKHFAQNEVFILPSISEPWGLVVEEALNNGLPVIVSDRVGCAEEIVQVDVNGLIFSLDDTQGLEKALVKIQKTDFYNHMRKNVADMDFEHIAENQVRCYI